MITGKINALYALAEKEADCPAKVFLKELAKREFHG